MSEENKQAEEKKADAKKPAEKKQPEETPKQNAPAPETSDEKPGDGQTDQSQAAEADQAQAPEPLDYKQTHLVKTFAHDRPLTTCRFDPTGKYVFAGTEDFNVYRWDVEVGDESKTTFTGHDSWVRSFDFSPSGDVLYTGGYDDKIGVWDARAAEPKPEMIEAHRGWVRWVRVSPDGKLLASCGNDNLVKVWSLPGMTLVHALEGHKRYPYAAEFHPDGKRLVSFDLLGVIKEWNLESGEELRTFEAKDMWGYDNTFAADMGGARDLKFNADGSRLAVAGLTKLTNAFAGTHDAMFTVFDWETGQPTLKFSDAFKGMAWGVRFHPEGFLIGGGSPRAGNKGILWFFQEPEPVAAKNEKADADTKPEKEAEKKGDEKKGDEKPEADQIEVQTKPLHTVNISHGSRAIDLAPNLRDIAVAQVDNKLCIYRMTAKPPEPKKDEKDAEKKVDDKKDAKK